MAGSGLGSCESADLYYEMSYDLRWPDSGPDPVDAAERLRGSQRWARVYLLSAGSPARTGNRGPASG